MTFKLLGNDTGVIITRDPEIVSGDVTLSFEGALAGSTAIISTEKRTHFIPIENGSCSIHAEHLDGNIAIAVAARRFPKRSHCEGIKALQLGDGRVLISPADADLQRIIVNLRIEIDAIRTAQNTLKKNYEEISARLEEYMSGHNLL